MSNEDFTENSQNEMTSMDVPISTQGVNQNPSQIPNTTSSVENNPTQDIPQPNKSKPKIRYNVNVVMLKDFNSLVIDKLNLNKFLKIKLSKRLIMRMFDYYAQHIKRECEDEFRWVLNKDYFKTVEEWEGKIRVLADYPSSFNSITDPITQEQELEFIQEIADEFKTTFTQYYFEVLKPKTKDVQEIMSEEEDDEVYGFKTYIEFKKENPQFNFEDFGLKEEIEEERNIGNYYILNESIQNTFLTDIVLKHSPTTPKFLVNPKFKLSKFNRNKINITQRLKIKVRKLIKFEGSDMSVVGNYFYTCPSCFKELIYKPSEMNKMKIQHVACPMEMGANGRLKNVGIRQSSYRIGNSLKTYCYEVSCFSNEDEVEKEQQFFFSFRDDIKPGIYYTDAVIFSGGLTSPDDKQLKTFMFGVKDVSYKILDDMINVDEGNKLADSFGCQPHKIFTIWNAVIKYYRKYKGIELNPRKGGLLQLFLMFSSIARNVFNNRNFPIAVIGDTSISKTYPAKLISELMDVNSNFTSGPKSQTYAGIYGGINTKYHILGKARAVFQEGLAGQGMVVFDEANHFFENPEFNEELKSLQNDEINIAKIGGEIVQQRFTPCIFMNFSSYHKGTDISLMKDTSYEGLVKFYYWKVLKEMGFDIDGYSYHKVRKAEADIYVSKKNLYLPLQNYENEELREAVSIVRNIKHKKDICWWSGGSVPAQNRFLFDCVVKRTTTEDKPIWSVVESESQNVYDIATHDFIETVIAFCGVDKHKINLKRYLDNNPEVLEQLEKLKANIIHFLNKDKDIINHFKFGGRIDEKLSGLVLSFLMIVQLTDNPKSVALNQSTRDLAKKILLKCKIGLTEDQYNFIDNSYRPDESIVNNKKYSSEEVMERVMIIEEHQNDKKMQDNIKKIMEESKMEEGLRNSERVDVKHNLDFSNFNDKPDYMDYDEMVR